MLRTFFFPVDATKRKGCDGCTIVDPINYHTQLKEFIIGYVKGLKEIREPEYNRYCKDYYKDCKIKFNHTTNFTHYKYPNGDSKFEFNATFDVWDAKNPLRGVKDFWCKNFEVVLHNLCRNCPRNPIQFLNKNNIECERHARIKPWQHRKSIPIAKLATFVEC